MLLMIFNFELNVKKRKRFYYVLLVVFLFILEFFF